MNVSDQKNWNGIALMLYRSKIDSYNILLIQLKAGSILCFYRIIELYLDYYYFQLLTI